QTTLLGPTHGFRFKVSAHESIDALPWSPCGGAPLDRQSWRDPKVCSRCDGYGVECCDVCEGRGRILWEGKMSHMDSCSRCFGSCTKKCPRCGGSRMKKGDPPIVQRSKFLPPKSI
ncbi:hypothetical protein MARPO_0054s0008, partial [Marchantia polymorpha]